MTIFNNKDSVQRVGEILHGLNNFMCLYLLISSANCSMFCVYADHYNARQLFKQANRNIIIETSSGVRTDGKLSSNYLFLMSVSACLSPTTSSMHCTFCREFMD